MPPKPESEQPGRRGTDPGAPSDPGREGAKADGTVRADGKTEPHRSAEADGINRIKASSAEWREPALAAQLLDSVLRRIRDEGLLNTGPVYSGSGPVYTINVSDAQAGNLYISGRDLTTGKSHARGEGSRRARQVREEDLEFVRDVYSRPPRIAMAEGVFQKRRLVVLRGAPGSGLRTAGLWLAATYTSGKKVFLLSPGRLLGALHGDELEKGAVYVVPALDAQTAAKINEFTLDEIEAWTSDGGWMVITAGSSVPLNREVVAASDLVVDEVGRPDPVAVARGHARCELDRLTASEAAPAECAGRLRDWLAEDDISQWLRERPEPRLAAQAGRALARAALSEQDPRAILRPLEDPKAHAARWFAAHPDTAQRAFMVATSVLAGSSYVSIADAAALLYDELKGFRVRHERQDFWSGLAEESWLEVVRENQPTPLGFLPVEAMKFRSGRVQTAILEHAWRRTDGLRLATCAWLKALGGSGSTEIRARAGAAVGILALWDFEYTLRTIVLPWAASKQAVEREAAALALSIPARDTRFSDATWRLVLGWCDMDVPSNIELVRTAIYALGGPLGAEEPETSVAVLREVAEGRGWDLVPDIASSLVVLAAGGQQAAIRSALIDWTSRKPDPTALERETRLVGLTCFLVCASAFAATPGHATRPVILGPSDGGLRSIAYLWGRTLDTPSIRDWALGLLRSWFQLRDGRDEDDGYVLGLVEIIAGLDNRQRERLEDNCYRWANDRRQPSKTAREALALLRRLAVGTKSIK